MGFSIKTWQSKSAIAIFATLKWDSVGVTIEMASQSSIRLEGLSTNRVLYWVAISFPLLESVSYTPTKFASLNKW